LREHKSNDRFVFKRSATAIGAERQGISVKAGVVEVSEMRRSAGKHVGGTSNMLAARVRLKPDTTYRRLIVILAIFAIIGADEVRKAIG
jgi:hypothetical protein